MATGRVEADPARPDQPILTTPPERAGSAEKPRDDVAERFVESVGVRLFVREMGDGANPTLVFVHGYPDTNAVWDEVVARLRDRFHVVTYDARGAGRSTRPRGLTSAGYALERLSADLGSVLEATCPGRPAHLVGHDWGSIQLWEPVTDPRLASRIASFTSISGPCLDHAGHWIRSRLGASPHGWAQLIRQGLRSWYIGFFHLPILPKLAWRGGLAERHVRTLHEIGGITPRPGHPASTLARDGRLGMGLYRANMLPTLLRPRDRRTEIPVQLVVPLRDAHVSPALHDDLDGWASRLWVRRVPAGHWVQRSHPDAVARWVAEFVDGVEGAPPSRSLRRARAAVARKPFDDHLVLITGAGSGIGRATALAFADQGAEIVAVDIDEEAAARTAVLARALGPTAHSYPLDVSDAPAVEHLAEAVARDQGVPDVLVNNAGIGIAGPFLDTTVEDWERIIDVNLWGVIHGCRVFVPRMVARAEGGHVVNVASAAAYIPSRALPAYATTKAAVLMLTQCLRAELAEEDIGVTAICPGVVDTGITRRTRFVGLDQGEQARRQTLMSRIYRRRGFSPDRVANEILRAVRANAAVVPVTPEAKVGLALSRLSPGALRALARIDPNARVSRRSR